MSFIRRLFCQHRFVYSRSVSNQVVCVRCRHRKRIG